MNKEMTKTEVDGSIYIKFDDVVSFLRECGGDNIRGDYHMAATLLESSVYTFEGENG